MLDVLVIGSGPVGLACAIEAQRQGLAACVIDKGSLVNSIVGYPINMEFFSTPELIEIGGHPFPIARYKPSREDAIEYYRLVTTRERLDVRLHERVIDVRGNRGDFTVVTDRGEHRARHVVVALGPWSADLLRPLGYRVPLDFERGYHREFTPDPARPLRRPIHDADGSFVMTPMENGIRVSSGVELTARDAPSSFAQLDAVLPLARAVAGFGDPVGEVWRGARPTLPDSLPMIGPAPRHAGLWLAFGHQHIGFTTGPATGAAIAAMIAGRLPDFDTASFSPGRYL